MNGRISLEIATRSSIDERSVLGENCVIKPGAVVENSVIGEGVHIEERAEVRNSVIWSHSRISNSAKVESAIVAKGCYIRPKRKGVERIRSG